MLLRDLEVVIQELQHDGCTVVVGGDFSWATSTKKARALQGMGQTYSVAEEVAARGMPLGLEPHHGVGQAAGNLLPLDHVLVNELK
jgi:hypothetical protein